MSSSSSEPTYTIIVSGVEFKLSEASLQGDSPGTNLLAMALLGDFSEAREKTLVLERSAVCFALIRDHLNGYTIFPLDASVCSGLDEARVLRYLRDDAEYYGLQRLAGAVRAEMDAQASSREAKMQAQSLYEKERIGIEHAKIHMATHEARISGHLRHMETVRTYSDKIREWMKEDADWDGQQNDPWGDAERLANERAFHLQALKASLKSLGSLVTQDPSSDLTELPQEMIL